MEKGVSGGKVDTRLFMGQILYMYLLFIIIISFPYYLVLFNLTFKSKSQKPLRISTVLAHL